MGYPDTVEKRRAGMKLFRARLLAAHERLLASGTLKGKTLRDVTEYRDAIKAAQVKRGEVQVRAALKVIS